MIDVSKSNVLVVSEIIKTRAAETEPEHRSWAFFLELEIK